MAESTPEVLNTAEISQEAYEAYSEGMLMASREPMGTSYSVFGDYDVMVCSKSGTAQHGSGGSDNCSYICYAPADDPEIAISIYVEKGGYSGRLGYIARAILDEYFNQTTSDESLPTENALS